MRRPVYFNCYVFFLFVFCLIFPSLFAETIVYGEENDACVKCHTDAKLIDRLVARNRKKHAPEAAG
ncbi:MAG TPA: hypothetical protein ENG51_01625 [Deltaproteobacteria bacterium]|nr:MAG: hypothetical protein DRG83_10295 [Deltaproteobacteria bacterium]RLB09557.1 MAG: hypothetical protein DRG59_02025 [Deltaproteobacteria bacterium]HDM75152.1 hypothetical protein [Deltaproteobacteria bacterium]